MHYHTTEFTWTLALHKLCTAVNLAAVLFGWLHQWQCPPSLWVGGQVPADLKVFNSERWHCDRSLIRLSHSNSPRSSLPREGARGRASPPSPVCRVLLQPCHKCNMPLIPPNGASTRSCSWNGEVENLDLRERSQMTSSKNRRFWHPPPLVINRYQTVQYT